MALQFIEFDKPRFIRLKAHYQEALDYHEQSFIFDGEEFLTDYAKYVIQFLTDKFKETKHVETEQEDSRTEATIINTTSDITHGDKAV